MPFYDGMAAFFLGRACGRKFSIRMVYRSRLAVLLRAAVIVSAAFAAPAFAEEDVAEANALKLRRLAIEAAVQYSYQPYTTNATLTDGGLGGNGQTNLNFSLPAYDGVGFAGRLEAEVFRNFSLVAGAQYKVLSVKYKSYAATLAGSPAATLIYRNGNEDISYKNWTIDLVARAKTRLFGGEIFAGLGAGIVMPFQWTWLTKYDYLSGYGTGTAIRSVRTVKNFNSAIVGVAEIGYSYAITNRISLAVSFNIVFGSSSNLDTTTETTASYANDTTSKYTRVHRKSFTPDEAASYYAASGSTSELAIYEALNITDIGVRGSVLFRML